MKKYDVTVKREPGWWIISVPELDDITSHASTLNKVEFIARDLISAWLDCDEDSFSVNLQIIAPRIVKKLLTQAQHADEKARESQTRATHARKEAVATLLNMGLSMREAAQILDISHQRVSQLAS
ncbi:MAG TPA: hypothetical protein PKB15_03985 [Acidimicrobiia bacterium]|nr:hypothetical protein [Acidimicrobiia bacterium]